MFKELLYDGECHVTIPYTAAGTTTIDGLVHDMQGKEDITFLAAFGTITATGTPGIKVRQSDSSDMSGSEDLTGSANLMADTDSGKGVLTEVYRPTKRYVQCQATRAVANAVIGAVFAVVRGLRKTPSTHGSTIIRAEVFASPAGGTA